MLEKFRENDLEYITLMLVAGVIAVIVFSPIDWRYGAWCLLASILFALLMWAASIVLDIQEKR